jgi:hypothetical protein
MIIKYGFYSESCQKELEIVHPIKTYNHYYITEQNEEVLCHCVIPIDLVELANKRMKDLNLKQLEECDNDNLLKAAFKIASSNYHRDDKIFKGIIKDFSRKEDIISIK